MTSAADIEELETALDALLEMDKDSAIAIITQVVPMFTSTRSGFASNNKTTVHSSTTKKKKHKGPTDRHGGVGLGTVHVPVEFSDDSSAEALPTVSKKSSPSQADTTNRQDKVADVFAKVWDGVSTNTLRPPSYIK